MGLISPPEIDFSETLRLTNFVLSTSIAASTRWSVAESMTIPSSVSEILVSVPLKSRSKVDLPHRLIDGVADFLHVNVRDDVE